MASNIRCGSFGGGEFEEENRRAITTSKSVSDTTTLRCNGCGRHIDHRRCCRQYCSSRLLDHDSQCSCRFFTAGPHKYLWSPNPCTTHKRQFRAARCTNPSEWYDYQATFFKCEYCLSDEQIGITAFTADAGNTDVQRVDPEATHGDQRNLVKAIRVVGTSALNIEEIIAQIKELDEKAENFEKHIKDIYDGISELQFVDANLSDKIAVNQFEIDEQEQHLLQVQKDYEALRQQVKLLRQEFVDLEKKVEAVNEDSDRNYTMILDLMNRMDLMDPVLNNPLWYLQGKTGNSHFGSPIIFDAVFKIDTPPGVSSPYDVLTIGQIGFESDKIQPSKQYLSFGTKIRLITDGKVRMYLRVDETFWRSTPVCAGLSLAIDTKNEIDLPMKLYFQLNYYRTNL